MKRASSTTVKKVQHGDQRKLGREVGEVGFEFNEHRPEISPADPMEVSAIPPQRPIRSLLPPMVCRLC